jgi:hypothetical protein
MTPRLGAPDGCVDPATTKPPPASGAIGEPRDDPGPVRVARDDDAAVVLHEHPPGAGHRRQRRATVALGAARRERRVELAARRQAGDHRAVDAVGAGRVPDRDDRAVGL